MKLLPVSGDEKDIEILALRHQLAILLRQIDTPQPPDRTPRTTTSPQRKIEAGARTPIAAEVPWRARRFSSRRESGRRRHRSGASFASGTWRGCRRTLESVGRLRSSCSLLHDEGHSMRTRSLLVAAAAGLLTLGIAPPASAGATGVTITVTPVGVLSITEPITPGTRPSTWPSPQAWPLASTRRRSPIRLCSPLSCSHWWATGPCRAGGSTTARRHAVHPMRPSKDSGSCRVLAVLAHAKRHCDNAR
jgi:hypothetical protein